MFGGLELKGAGDEEKANGAATTPTSTAASAFGFLNAAAEPSESAAAPAADPLAAAGSGFSFLNAAAPAPETATATEPAGPAASSGFSFMATAPAPAPPEVPSVETGGLAESSGFSFMIPSPDKQAGEATNSAAPASVVSDEPSAAEAPPRSPPAPAAMSAFNFLSAALSADEADAPPPAPHSGHAPTMSLGSASIASSIVSAPSPVPAAPPNILEFSSNPIPIPAAAAPPSGLPAGAGITFGTATTAKPRKKKTRAQRVGMGGAGAAAAAVPPQAPAPAPVASPNRETWDAAAEAQRRADEFMMKKTLAEANKPAPSPTAAAAASITTNNNTKLDIPSYDQSPSLLQSASTDEEVARAKRAAEEAQKMTIPKEARGGFMGTFFKGFGSNSSLGGKGSTNNNSGHLRGSSPSTLNSVDKLSQQQQEMKRAAAERQMQLQQQQQPPKSEDEDDVVVVSTSVGGYHQPQPPVVVDAPAPAKNTQGLMTNFEPIQKPATQQQKFVVKKLAPTPKKKKTPTQAFEEYQALFAQSVHRAIQQVEAVRSQQRMLSEERFVSVAKQRLATQQIQQTEAQLQVAVDNEDYELADQLGQVIEAHKREKAEVASVIDSIAMGLVQLESQKALVVQGVATCFDNLALHIKELHEQETSKGGESDSGTLKKFGMISKQLSAEQERLHQDLKHLERDESLVAEERSELESAISEQSGDYEGQRNSVEEKLSTIEEEIAELRRQLEVKTKIAAGLRTEMHGLEDNISKVRVKFSRQLTRVDKKERTIQENRLEWQTESAMFKRQKEAHEMQVQSHSEALLVHDALIKTLDDELKLCKEFAGLVSTKLGFMQKEAEDAEKEGDLAQLQADVVKCEAACSEAKVVLKAAIASVSNLEAEHSMLIARVPRLESEKQAYAAKRDFKAASKASKDIKDATARLKECEEELIGEAADKKKAAEEEMAKLSVELDKTRKIAEAEEKVAGIARMHDLAEQIKQLVATKEEKCGKTSSNQNTVKGVGAFVLEGQIKVLKDEGHNLGIKYGGWNDLVKDILGEDEEIMEEPPSEQNEADSPPAPAPVDDGLTSEERVAKVRDLVKRLQVAEEALEAAAEREDFDEAARLQEVFENLQTELESANLTDEESELAFADEEPPAAAPAESTEAPTIEDDAETDDKVPEEGADEVIDEVVGESASGEEETPIEEATAAVENEDQPDGSQEESPAEAELEPADQEAAEEDEAPLETEAKNEETHEDEQKETKESEPDEVPSSTSDEVLASTEGEAVQEAA
jgi:hypothetical protein